jgi:hypothetical protein
VENSTPYNKPSNRITDSHIRLGDRENEIETGPARRGASARGGYEAIGRRVYTAGSQRIWWQPLQAPDHMRTGATYDATQSKNILIVEDESYLAELMADVLQSEGHKRTLPSLDRGPVQ